MKKFFECNFKLFTLGGVLYGFVEILWRNYTHWTMVVTGGTCFAVLYRIFQRVTAIPMWTKCMIGSTVITGLELAAGYIVNIKLKMGVWDYSRQPLNFHGQICPLYSILWGILTFPIVRLCSYLDKKYKW